VAQIEAGPVAYRRSLFVTACACAVLHHLGLLTAGTALARDQLGGLARPRGAVCRARSRRAHPRHRAGHRAALGRLRGRRAGLHPGSRHRPGGELDRKRGPGETAYLWDELAGHGIWYAGAAVVMFVLAATMARESPRAHPLGVLAALGAGATWATNVLGGHTIPLAIVVALAGIGWGWTRRHTVAWLTGIAGAAALVVLAGAALV